MRKRLLLLTGMVAAVATAAIVGFGPGFAADHKDGPRTTGDPKADINDVYAFRSPENNANVVFALTVNPLTAPAQNMSATLDPGVSYNLNIDTDNDLVADVVAAFKFTGTKFTVTGLGADPITGDVTPLSNTENIPPVINTAGGIRIFVGLRDDPFIMDLRGIQAFLANPVTPAMGVRPAGQTPVDFFGGTNVSTIVVELPVTAVTGGSNANSGTVNAWGSTFRGSAQVDRMAIPGLNVLVVPEAQKDAFNSTAHADSTDDFGDTITSQIEAVRESVMDVLPAENGGPLGDLPAADVSAAVSADAVTIDFSKPLQFPNGRRLQDDVVNASLGLVLNRGGAAGVSDAIDTLDKPLLSTFPYAAPPHLQAGTAPPPPAPTPRPGTTPATGRIAAPDTGSGGSMDDSASSAGTWIVLGLGALMVVVGTGVVLRRRSMD